MIIKNIAKIFRNSRGLGVYTTPGGVQWVGNNSTFYAVPMLPPMSFVQACEVFDYSDKVKNSLVECKITDTHGLLNDDYPYEVLIEELPEDIVIGGVLYKMFTCAGRTFLVTADLLTPMADYSEDITYYMRYLEGSPVLCVKRGLITISIICIFKLSGKLIEEHCERLESIIRKLREEFRQIPRDDDDDQIKL